jgi:hypothetical protein
VFAVSLEMTPRICPEAVGTPFNGRERTEIVRPEGTPAAIVTVTEPMGTELISCANKSADWPARRAVRKMEGDFTARRIQDR